MGELAIRRNRVGAAAGYRGTDRADKAEKTEATGQTRKATAGFTVSESLRQRLTRTSQAESQYREGRRTLQAGEVVLSKVQDCLNRIAELARESAEGKDPDRDALQAELEHLQTEIDRMVSSAAVGGVQLFLDGDTALDEGMETLLRALMDGAELGQTLPDWLTQAVAQDGMTPEQILSSLGLDKNASAADILKAIASRPLEGNSAAGRLAALYLGAVIAGSGGSADLEAALDGLRQLLEKVAGGTPPDEALQALTDGEFTSFADFQSQFTEGTAPDLEAFLVDLLLSDAPLLSDVPLLTGDSLLNLLSAAEGMDLELLMSLLTTTPSPAPEAAAQDALPPDSAAPAPQAADGASPAPLAADSGAESPSPPSPAPPVSPTSLEVGNVQAEGRDLSGVSLNAATGELTVGGAADVAIQGTEQQQPAVLLTGTGTVTLRDVRAAVLTIAADARVFSSGESVLAEVRLKENTVLTLGGSGPVRIGVLRAGETNVLRLADGAAVTVESSSTVTAPVVLEGVASFAAQAANVQDLSGNRLQPFDILWKTLLPGWNNVTSLSVDGRQARLAPLSGGEPVRLWLTTRGDSGFPAHTLVLRGRDASGRPRTRYAYLYWNRRTGAFEELSMYPNPFTVTGGESGRDWAYDEASHTLHILTPQVTAISGGAGTDANQAPFSGRIALADNIGSMELTLGGVVCRVTSGRAFHLGRANDVTLLLQSGTSNLFESGAGCAGISLGDGTSLHIDAPSSPGGDAVGALTATGGAGGAGIGRDSGSRDRTSRIVIRGGVITATGTGGGAGIGAGKHGYMGPVTISGGVVTSVGGAGGGAGIGGALGAPVGDISIRGGTVTATAANHAAAIGAGILGDSGDIRVDGTARIVKAVGGDPGADIGACLFGGCGDVFISRGADIGSARLWDRPGISLQMGEEAVTLPQFRLSSRALQLNRLCVSTPEEARAARATIDADRRWVSQIQTAYSVLYNRLGQSFGNLQSQSAEEEAPVRDAAAAGTLLRSTRQSILLQSSQALSGKRDTEDIRQLLR